MSYRILVGHTSPETAYYVPQYPYGRGRCIKRVWVETATKGSKKGYMRRAEETTISIFNYEYTDKLRNVMCYQEKVDEINQWAIDKVRRSPAFWNATKYSNYDPLLVLYLQKQEDGRDFVQSLGLSPFSAGPKELLAFSMKVGDQLPKDLNDKLQAWIAVSKKRNPEAWDKLLSPTPTTKDNQ